MSTAPDEFLTTSEVMSMLRVSRSTLLRWVDDGRLAATRLGPRALRFRRSDVDDFVARAS